MQEHSDTYYFIYYVFIVVFSGLITLLSIPSILYVAHTRHLYDDIGHFRKQHDHGIPRLGGVAIFISFIITMLLFSMIDKSLPISYLLTATIILFIVGIKDDLSGVNSSTKFFIQFIVATMLVALGGIRLSSMYGIFDIYDLPYILSAVLSILFIVLIVNSFNLIDGIDGLAGTTCIVVNGTFAALFIYIKHYELAAISLGMVGSVAGFLRYNLTPAKIFMGDAGSLLIGLISAVMAIKFIEINKITTLNSSNILSAPAIALAVLIGPIFDTLRVFALRILKGVSPFTADRNHIHHRMLRLGYTHIHATLILAGINIFSIAMALIFRHLGNFFLIIAILANSMLFNWFITVCIRTKERESFAMRNLFA
ncbi:MAG: undecaprenyl-phosphate alpha-N-acetylglucosaminyl 1-phosphate transferase [Mucilaginibacter sp.]|nr:undecaprenyl-phosphate alpha-N-acetylglucosaminyl 1-phosphate transferase [Mucilaginibacter sp.]